MFLGKFNHSLDNKNRLSLPSKFVCKLPKQICISKGFDGCLEIRTPAEFQKRLNILTEKDENKKTNRDLLRIFTNNTIEVNIDKANRILISSELLKEASIIKDVVVCGSANRIEI
jgi:MraZ protein